MIPAPESGVVVVVVEAVVVRVSCKENTFANAVNRIKRDAVAPACLVFSRGRDRK